jgi:hypothetical protein
VFDGPRARIRATVRRLRRLERRESRALRRWLEHTPNLIHLSIVTVFPVILGLVTYLANVTPVSFLLFPPLASGTYTLFADPHGRYASPRIFVGGMTAGALCGSAALVGSRTLLGSVGGPGVAALGAAGAIFLTGLVTWGLDLEEPTAFSTALLVLLTGNQQLFYVIGIAVTSTLVAALFWVWRSEVYEERARYLYGTTQADDHVLVPMRPTGRDATTAMGAQIAAAHDAGKIVLLDVVPNETVAAAEAELIETGKADDEQEARAVAEAQTAADTAVELQARAERVRETYRVPCEIVVIAGDPDDAGVITEAARQSNCDLIVPALLSPNGGSPDRLVRDLFRSDIDVLALRSGSGATEWRRPLVTVGRGGGVAHAMVDYAQRLVGSAGTVSLCTCIDDEAWRREAESMLADLAETASCSCETRVARSKVSAFLERTADHHDLIFLGASTDRSAASRFVSPPTYERLEGVEADIAVVHRA